jgi:hypothetical protein
VPTISRLLRSAVGTARDTVANLDTVHAPLPTLRITVAARVCKTRGALNLKQKRRTFRSAVVV